jgi:hypothetical protein
VTYIAYTIAALLYAVGYLVGKVIALALWMWVAFLSGVKAGL